MLKNLSSLNYEMFCKILNNQSISKEKVDFNSLQEEIYNNLLSEFISPIEREDIFILQKRLEEEFLTICSFSLLKNYSAFNLVRVEELLKNNVLVLAELKNFKNPKRLLKLTRENVKNAVSLLTSNENCSKEFVSVKASKVVKAVYLTNIEVERIILNNN